MATPSIFYAGEPEQYAKTVLMPGDPMRAKFIAETYLENFEQISNIRGIPVYTGTYKGKRLTVTASGMGCPSMGIYSHDLYEYLGVESIIRVGTAGGIHPDLDVRDIVIGQASCTTSNFDNQFRLPGRFAPIADFGLLKAAVEQAEKMNLTYKVGNLFCADYFYDDAQSVADWQKVGVLAVEMESAALYTNAARFGKKALCIATVSDCPLVGKFSTPEECERDFTNMMVLALEIAQ
ncbi:purine-nucleoside phosphorylase [Christensenellaceae bacterium OttesenSCG-928-K19]|nr:purine-nucleoside phosphorylase [Christensenellaceae bacterium OttesenSCG-928-K19]